MCKRPMPAMIVMGRSLKAGERRDGLDMLRIEPLSDSEYNRLSDDPDEHGKYHPQILQPRRTEGRGLPLLAKPAGC